MCKRASRLLLRRRIDTFGDHVRLWPEADLGTVRQPCSRKRCSRPSNGGVARFAAEKFFWSAPPARAG